MRRERLFELGWARADRPAGAPEQAALATLRGPLALAGTLRQVGSEIAVPDPLAAWEAVERGLVAEPAPVGRLAPRRAVVRPMPVPRRPAVARALVAAAAVFVALAAISMKAVPGSPLYSLRRGLEATALVLSPQDGGLHVRLASARLDDLVHSLEGGPVADAPGLAGALVAERAAALGEGADVSGLDARIATEVPPALAGAPVEVASQVESIFGPLLPPAPEQTPPGAVLGGGVQAGSPPGGGSSGDGSSQESGSGSNAGGGSGSGGEGRDTTSTGSGGSGDGSSQDATSGDSGRSSQDSGSGDSASSDATNSDSPSPDPSSDPTPSPTCNSGCDSGGD